MKNLLLISLMVFIGCAASVQTEQYVGEYEKEKSMDEIVAPGGAVNVSVLPSLTISHKLPVPTPILFKLYSPSVTTADASNSTEIKSLPQYT